MSDINVADLTQTSINGTGVFDVLMRATKTHLDEEFSKNRIKGSEYATVYLGSVESVMRTALEFLMQRQRIGLEAQLMEQQILVAQAEVQKANAQVQVALAEVEKTRLEVQILQLSKDKIPAEIAHLQAQTSLIGQQKANLIAEANNIPKQGVVMDMQAANTAQQTTNLVSQELQIKSQTDLIKQQKLNAVATALNIPKEGLVLDGQKCKLDAEYDLLLGQALKGTAETTLLTQKTITEKAQTSSVGISADSVIGKQKALYSAQTDGFKRDAEQKAAKLLADTWNVRRTTDEGTKANETNKLDDGTVGRAITKMLAGVGA